ncbi:MAG: flagellar biosynthesis anti-sigma factor FlgM [Nitrospinae bacterium]|nr:flagellar biosynthesis anti-sigma factor FlgM [Nitrospinota bacterium]
MVIEGLTGGKPHELKAAEKADTSTAPARNPVSTGSGGGEFDAEVAVSERSRAAVKAYRIAMQTRPRLAIPLKVAQIKAQMASGSYHPSTGDVASAMMRNVA